MMTEIQLHTLTDIDQLISWRMEVLHCVFADAMRPDWEALEAANRQYYRRQLSTDGNLTIVATVDGMDAGCGALCLYEEMPSPDNPSGLCAYLMSIYVREQFRRRGVGHAIVSRLVSEAQRRHAGKIYLETSKMGRPLYLQSGFTPMEGMMHLQRHTNTDDNETA